MATTEFFNMLPETISPDVEQPITVASGNLSFSERLIEAGSYTDEAKKRTATGFNPENEDAISAAAALGSGFTE
ncbi:MAG: hypothetical protein LUQ50_00825 [Methanospirillum sp.]|uniref:hypothetical protein n=1 Tax=Methanospirillum sp. TaxID=45200 RepID=UPI002371C264|nr:hypothetical protein [Methanospirillum sp.]MDD1727595.1 hypothetical protein [Methanospirillum sp.]